MQITNIQANIKSNQYHCKQLVPLLKSLQREHISGTLYFDAQVNGEQKLRSRVLVLNDGEIIYGGLNIPNNLEFAQKLGKKFKPVVIDAALNLAREKAIAKTSFREILELLVKMRVLTWEQIETIAHHQVVLTLEQLLPYSGKFHLDPTIELDLGYGKTCHGLDWSKLMLDVNRREQEWEALFPLISSMEAIPHLPENAGQKITDSAVLKHLRQWVNGKRSLVDIAEKLDKDPLHIARSYLSWSQIGWVTFHESASRPSQNQNQPKNLPTILAVDDSPTMQAMIKYTLGAQYTVLLANNAMDGLNLLNENQVLLLLLDVAMPHMDGLEMCRTVRSMDKFRQLPIIMISGQDTLVDKLKGQIAGTNHYLIKPFDPEKLLELVNQYVSVGNT
jgi:twitching motility two-component system response regulator PilG